MNSKTVTQEFILSTFFYNDGNLFWIKNNKLAGGRNLTTNYWSILNMSAHSLIWIYHNGAIPEGKIIDHKDENRLNNRIENLRLATRSQNALNRKKENIDSFTKFKGVSFDKRRLQFYSRIKINGKYKFLGYFKTPEEAYEIYKDNCKKEHGDFSPF